ncbi:MAG: hypothetical protein AAF527_03370 [Pseudomonadota bacterium]
MTDDRLPLLDDCDTALSCLTALDPTVPPGDPGRYDLDVDAIRDVLRDRFGDDARYALLDMAQSAHGGWRNFAGALLSEWGGWREEDVAALRRALQLNPGSSIAEALADVGSDAAIRALVEDLKDPDGGARSVYALKAVGPRTLPFLLPALQTGSGYNAEDAALAGGEPWLDAVKVIAVFRWEAVVIADEWIAVARDRKEDPDVRIAALRGLGAMSSYLGERSRALRSVRRSSNPRIATQAFETLVEVHDPSVAEDFARSCQPSADKWDPFPWKSYKCLSRLAEFGSNAQSAGETIAAFLESQNAQEQQYAIDALRLIDYRPATDRIAPFLTSGDWRLVYASVRALSQFGARGRIADIEAATGSHWLWELKLYGRYIAARMAQKQPHFDQLTQAGGQSLGFRESFSSYPPPYDTRRESRCSSWNYGGQPLTFERERWAERSVIRLQDGELIGTNMGEFGGALVWRPLKGSPQQLIGDNVIALFETSSGILSIHGLSHLSSTYGFAALSTRDDDGAWSTKEVARFPTAAYQIKRLDGDVFAANASGRAIIFSPSGISEMLFCANHQEIQ